MRALLLEADGFVGNLVGSVGSGPWHPFLLIVERLSLILLDLDAIIVIDIVYLWLVGPRAGGQGPFDPASIRFGHWKLGHMGLQSTLIGSGSWNKLSVLGWARPLLLTEGNWPMLESSSADSILLWAWQLQDLLLILQLQPLGLADTVGGCLIFEGLQFVVIA